MGTRYDKITIEFNVEFSGIGEQTSSVTPNWHETQDPRFQDFLRWFDEVWKRNNPPKGENEILF